MRAISTISFMRCTGRSNRTPCQPSITCGPLVPSPSRNRPPESDCSVIAVMPTSAGVREPAWMMPEPSLIVFVRAAMYPSGVTASEPHASAHQTECTPSFSASTTKSTARSQSSPRKPNPIDACSFRRITAPFARRGSARTRAPVRTPHRDTCSGGRDTSLRRCDRHSADRPRRASCQRFAARRTRRPAAGRAMPCPRYCGAITKQTIAPVCSGSSAANSGTRRSAPSDVQGDALHQPTMRPPDVARTPLAPPRSIILERSARFCAAVRSSQSRGSIST